MRPETQSGTSNSALFLMTFIIAVHIASTLLTLFIAISLLSTRASNPLSARILGGNYLLFSLQNLLAIFVFTDVWPQAAGIRGIIAMLLGPALFLYFSSVLTSKEPTAKQLLLHLFPMLIMMSSLLFFDGFAADILITLSFFGYISYIAFQYLNSPEKSHQQFYDGLVLRWLGLLLCVMLVNLLVEVGIIFEVYSGTAVRESLSLQVGSLIFIAFHTFALILILTRAPLLEWMHELKELTIQKPTAVQLTEQELQIIYSRWQELVAEKELYLSESNITVSRSARMLGIPSRQLSQAINTIYGASFSQYLNETRVERAKKLLLQNPKSPVTEVYLSAGFSTKSHFHREFSRSTGMTPSEFREMKCEE